MKVNAVGERVLASMINKAGGHRELASGLIIADRDMESSGIRPRWFKVESVGPDVDKDFVKEGQYVYVEHGRWTNELKYKDGDDLVSVYMLDNEKCLMVSNEHPKENGYEV